MLRVVKLFGVGVALVVAVLAVTFSKQFNLNTTALQIASHPQQQEDSCLKDLFAAAMLVEIARGSFQSHYSFQEDYENTSKARYRALKASVLLGDKQAKLWDKGADSFKIDIAKMPACE